MLIVFEGISGSGKRTVMEMVRQQLVAQGRWPLAISFPGDGSTMASNLLQIELGRPGQATLLPKVAATMFALDRFERLPDLLTQLSQADCVLCNGYVPSNIAYQSARVPVEQRRALCDWIQNLEYRVLGLPVPDVVISLDVPPDLARQRLAKQGHRIAVYDTDEATVAASRSVFLSGSFRCGQWYDVPTFERINGQTVDIAATTIAQTVTERIVNYLGVSDHG